MHSNKYKHAWYRLRNLSNVDNFENQNDFAWMVKPMTACEVVLLLFMHAAHWFHQSLQNRFSKFSKCCKFLNRCQACLYLFEYNFQVDTKYSNEFQYVDIFENLVECWTYRLLTPVVCYTARMHPILFSSLSVKPWWQYSVLFSCAYVAMGYSR